MCRCLRTRGGREEVDLEAEADEAGQRSLDQQVGLKSPNNTDSNARWPREGGCAHGPEIAVGGSLGCSVVCCKRAAARVFGCGWSSNYSLS